MGYVKFSLEAVGFYRPVTEVKDLVVFLVRHLQNRT